MSVKSPLTIQERNILTLKAQGLISAQIGPILFLSPNTVNIEMRFILLKLHALNTPHAVAIALEHHIIHPNGKKTQLEGD